MYIYIRTVKVPANIIQSDVLMLFPIIFPVHQSVPPCKRSRGGDKGYFVSLTTIPIQMSDDRDVTVNRSRPFGLVLHSPPPPLSTFQKQSPPTTTHIIL